jgi:hypothetical protein
VAPQRETAGTLVSAFSLANGNDPEIIRVRVTIVGAFVRCSRPVLAVIPIPSGTGSGAHFDRREEPPVLITVVNEAPQEIVPNLKLLAAIRAITRQIFYDFEPYWHLSARLRLAVNQRRLAAPPSPGQVVLESIGVDLGDRADGALCQLDPIAGGALIFLQTWESRRTPYPKLSYCYGFHGMYGALPFPVGYVFATNENGAPRDDWSVTLSHEILELIANPHVNLLVDGPCPCTDPLPTGDGGVKAPKRVLVEREVCDPVKDSSYVVDEFRVSNFVLPLYFVERGEANERVDFLGVGLKSFDALNGGYVPTRNRASGAPGMRGRDYHGAAYDGLHPGISAHLRDVIRLPVRNRRGARPQTP